MKNMKQKIIFKEIFLSFQTAKTQTFEYLHHVEINFLFIETDHRIRKHRRSG